MVVQLSSRVLESLRCPACAAPLDRSDREFLCQSSACGCRYPVVGGVPVLIDEQSSVVEIRDYLHGEEGVLYSPRGDATKNPLRRLAHRLYASLPEVTRNTGTRENYARFAKLLLEATPRPLVLVIGGREVGKGMDPLLADRRIEFVESDIDFGPRTGLICDAHQLPFADGSVDGAVAQAVLEHVLDPHRCVAEIHRVLRQNGVVYAETPFLQRRHGGAYDFQRFTFLGHRRLFRRFTEVASGAAVGPGSALALTYTGFLLALAGRRALRVPLRVFGSLTSFWLKYLDRALVRSDVALDTAGGFFFLGHRSEGCLSDRDLVAAFRGLR